MKCGLYILNIIQHTFGKKERTPKTKTSVRSRYTQLSHGQSLCPMRNSHKKKMTVEQLQVIGLFILLLTMIKLERTINQSTHDHISSGSICLMTNGQTNRDNRYPHKEDVYFLYSPPPHSPHHRPPTHGNLTTHINYLTTRTT